MCKVKEVNLIYECYTSEALFYVEYIWGYNMLGRCENVNTKRPL